jgi:hypothetical protein
MGSDAGIYQDLLNTSIVERPKIIYNQATEKYVMWLHSDRDGYGYARAGVAGIILLHHSILVYLNLLE